MIQQTVKTINISTLGELDVIYLGTPSDVNGEDFQDLTDLYMISGAYELGADKNINPDSSITTIGATIQIFWIATLSNSASYSLFIAGTDFTSILIGNTNADITLKYDGSAWKIDYVNIDYPVTSVSGRTGAVTLTKSDVGLSAVENTALSTWAGSANITTVGTIASGVWSGTAIVDGKIASAATWNAKAPTAAPAFSGNATTAVTPTYGDSSTKIPNTAFVQQAIAPLNVFYASPAIWAAGTYDLAALATGVNNIVEPLSITGNIILESLGTPATSVSEITIALPFSGGAWTVTAGTNTAFSTITGADTHTSVLTLVWSTVAGKYIQKSFSQN